VTFVIFFKKNLEKIQKKVKNLKNENTSGKINKNNFFWKI